MKTRLIVTFSIRIAAYFVQLDIHHVYLNSEKKRYVRQRSEKKKKKKKTWNKYKMIKCRRGKIIKLRVMQVQIWVFNTQYLCR